MSGIPGALSGALNLLQGAARLISDPGHFLQDSISWLGTTLFPPELQTWFLGTIGAPGSTWDVTQVFQNMYHALQAPALLIAGVAAAARVLRGSIDARVPPAHALFDVLPRLVVVVLVIGLPTTQVSLAYDVLVFVVNASTAVAHEILRLILTASLLQGVQAGEGWFTHMYRVIANAGHSLVAVVIGGIPLLILLLYAAFLMVVRTIMLGFCVATAPICIASLAFDRANRVFEFWLDLLVGALLTPIVFALVIALSVAMASSVVSAAIVGPILAFAVMAGGLWFSAKLVHHITWRHFAHGGALAGFAAGVSTMLAPVHHAATAGYLAQSVGTARRDGQGALGFIRRLGAAGPDIHPAALASGSAHTLKGHGMRTAPAVAAGFERIPDVASLLSPAGRVAVAGSEAVFSQSAFKKFSSEGARLIGGLTDDIPYGHVSQAERARVAWERYPQRDRESFATDHLAQWLGTAEDTDAQLATAAPSVT